MANFNISRTSGIYIIKNVKNGMFYLGQAQNLRRRRNEHFNKLQLNKHGNCHLQRAWNKYGEKAFEFIVLEYIPIEKLDEREIYFVALYRERNMCYNMQDGGHTPRGRIITDETRRKIGEGHKNPSEETRRKMSEAAKNRSIDHRQKISEANKNRPPVSEETKRKISEAGKRRQPPSEETRRKLGDVHKKHYIVTNPDGIEFDVVGLRQFCIKNNLSNSDMSAVAKGKYSHHKGWKCRKANN